MAALLSSDGEDASKYPRHPARRSTPPPASARRVKTTPSRRVKKGTFFYAKR
ncbi:hypothetical protein GCM10009679_10640 [Saccharothrix algeriensis]|uniref:Uncharacterized protein n=1 Tax=Catellatospora bangladeshensis TaxID=310355 RepID=A0A8J3JC64_9ACTN|nr:hypothetical protein Cba03nite_35210 [Catellatospora bangladeshensis]